MALRWEESDGALVPQGDLIYDPGAIWKMYRAGADSTPHSHIMAKARRRRRKPCCAPIPRGTT